MGRLMTTTPAETVVESVIRFLDRSDVEALFDTAARDSLSPERLANTPLPAGLTLRETEELLAAVRRLGALRSPFPDFEGRPYWYALTQEMLWNLRVIGHECAQGSDLSRAIEDREGKRFLVRSLVDEAIAVSRLDGASISHRSARELLQLDATPSSDDERVVVNTHRALNDLARYADQDVTPQLLIALYERVTSGTDHPPFDPGEMRREAATAMTRVEMLEALCAVANDSERVRSEHPAITALLLQWAVQYWQPFPRWNGALSSLLFRLQALRRHYPVLGFLPISSTIAAWQDGEITPPTVIIAPEQEEVVLDRYGEGDLSLAITVRLQLVRIALEKLHGYVTEATERDVTLRSLLQHDTTLNSRQRSVLGRALRLPDATFRIRYHQTTHNIAYSTARADLMELQKSGYLQVVQEGKAMVYTAAPDLAQKVVRVAALLEEQERRVRPRGRSHERHA